MAQSFNEALFDAMVRHQVGLLRYAGSVRNKVWQLLDATEGDIRRQILRAERAGLGTPGQVARLESLLAKLRETRIGGWKKANEAWFEDVRAIALAEPGFFNSVIASAVPVELGAVLPEPARLRALVTHQPFQGRTMRQWAKKLQDDDLERIRSQIVQGLVQGEDVGKIARRIVGTVSLKGADGVTQVTRREAAAIVRTVNSGVTAAARAEYMALNSDLAPEELFTATLDSRTTPICRRLDGTRYKVGEGPKLPLHYQERSLYSPIVDGQVVGTRPRRDFTERQLLREFAAQKGFKAPTKRSALPHGTKSAYDEFARRRMRELTGRTPATTTYGEWLRRQSAANQDDILGPTRGALFRRGELDVSQFVELNGRELTLAELAARHEEAFTAAGLDPEAFL